MAEWPKEKGRLDLGLSGLDSDERPKFLKALGALGLPIDTFGLGLGFGYWAQFCDGDRF